MEKFSEKDIVQPLWQHKDAIDPSSPRRKRWMLSIGSIDPVSAVLLKLTP